MKHIGSEKTVLWTFKSFTNITLYIQFQTDDVRKLNRDKLSYGNYSVRNKIATKY